MMVTGELLLGLVAGDDAAGIGDNCVEKGEAAGTADDDTATPGVSGEDKEGDDIPLLPISVLSSPPDFRPVMPLEAFVARTGVVSLSLSLLSFVSVVGDADADEGFT